MGLPQRGTALSLRGERETKRASGRNGGEDGSSKREGSKGGGKEEEEQRFRGAPEGNRK